MYFKMASTGECFGYCMALWLEIGTKWSRHRGKTVLRRYTVRGSMIQLIRLPTVHRQIASIICCLGLECVSFLPHLCFAEGRGWGQS